MHGVSTRKWSLQTCQYIGANTYLEFLLRPKLLEYCRNALTFSIAYGTETVACNGTKHKTRYVGYDEPETCVASMTQYHTPHKTLFTSTTRGTKVGPPWGVTFDLWAKKLPK